MANSVYTAGFPLGAALSNFSLPMIGTGMGWRGIFGFAGLSGVAMAIVLAIFLHRPKRSRFEMKPALALPSR